MSEVKFRNVAHWDIRWWQKILLFFCTKQAHFDHAMGILTTYKILGDKIFILGMDVLPEETYEPTITPVKRGRSRRPVRLVPNLHGID